MVHEDDEMSGTEESHSPFFEANVIMWRPSAVTSGVYALESVYTVRCNSFRCSVVGPILRIHDLDRI